MSLTTAPAITLSRYLDSTYHPDRDFVDGTLEERNVGELNHSLSRQRWSSG